MGALALSISLFVSLSVPAATETSTTAPRIDLLIMGRGGELYSAYGHAAIRVIHPDGKDVAYNFGGVDINVPYFWVSLMRGRIKTYLEVTSYTDLLLQYSGEDRTITGRTLALTPEQAREVVRRLDAIYNSPDRYYFYHHVLDNCTTRVAKLFDEILGGALSKQSTAKVKGTYRDWIISRMRSRFWVYVTMDLTGNGLGDVPITEWDATFLPDGLERVIDKATIDGRRFVVSKYVDYKSLNFDDPVIWDWPWTKVYILFLAPFLLLAFWKRRPLVFVFGLVFGLLGLIDLGFWVFSDYTFFWRNWNLALFPPTHLFLAFAVLKDPRRWRWSCEAYLRVHLALLLVVLLLWATGVIVQAIHPMLWIAIPVTLSLIASGYRISLDRPYLVTR